MSNDLDGSLTRISRSQHFWSRISRKRCVLRTKLLENTNRKSQMAGRFVSDPMTLSDLERPDVRNRVIFRRILITLVRSATSLDLHKCVSRSVGDSWVSFLNNMSLGYAWQNKCNCEMGGGRKSLNILDLATLGTGVSNARLS